jgi:allantoate deiminase
VRTTDETTNRAERVIARCHQLARLSEDAHGTKRTFLSAPMHDCHREITAWLTAIGVEVRIDAAGNLRGWYAGAEAKAPRLMLGSHLDTVPNAGAYDGVLGVVLAIALLEALDGRRLPFGIEIAGFSEE